MANAKENKNLNRFLTLFQCIKISSYYVGALLTLGGTHTYTFCFKFPTNMNHIYNHLYSYDKPGLVVFFFKIVYDEKETLIYLPMFEFLRIMNIWNLKTKYLRGFTVISQTLQLCIKFHYMHK